MDTQAFQQSLSLHAGRMAGMGQERLHSSRTLEPKVKLEIQASPLTIRLNLLKEILAVPTCSRQEDRMVAFLIEHVRHRPVAVNGYVLLYWTAEKPIQRQSGDLACEIPECDMSGKRMLGCRPREIGGFRRVEVFI